MEGTNRSLLLGSTSISYIMCVSNDMQMVNTHL